MDSLNDTDGSFSNDYSGYAYLNGPFAVLTYDNGGWNIDRFSKVFAHETGHTFGAPDEYTASGCSTTTSYGYLSVPNTSCNNGGVTSDVSLMGEGSELDATNVDLSASARDALGWRNPVSGAGPGAVVDVVRTATASLTPYSPDPTSDSTPTFAATAGNIAFPPGSGHAQVSISKVASAEQNVDDGAWSTGGVDPADGAFKDEAEAYSVTPGTPIAGGTHTFRTRSTNNFGHVSPVATDSLTISTGSVVAPGAPTAVTAAAADASAAVSWTAPTNDGGATISTYTVTANPGGRTATATGTARTATVTGLTNGTAYTFTVTATNTAGTGPASTPSSPVTPTGATAPLINENFSTSAANFTKISGGNWTTSSGRYVLTAPADAGSATANSNISVHNANVPGDFVLTASAATTPTSSAFNDFSIIFDYRDRTNYYFASFSESNDTNTSGIFKVVAGTRTQLADITTGITAGTAYPIRIERQGATIRVYRSNTLAATTTDTTFTTGKVGFGTRNDGGTFDDLTVTATTSTTITAPDTSTEAAPSAGPALSFADLWSRLRSLVPVGS